MRISLEQIDLYSRCPNLFFLSQEIQVAPERKLYVCSRVIEKAYSVSTETHFRVDWRRIVGWTDKLVFEDLNPESEEQWEEGRLRSEQCLSFLQTWYNGIYMKENVEAMTQFQVELALRDHIVYSQIPVAKLTNPLTVQMVSDDTKLIQHNLYAQGMAALVAQSARLDEVILHILYLHPRGGFSQGVVTLSRDMIAKTVKTLEAISYLIANKVKYPVVSASCDTCLYYRRCRVA